MIDFLAANAGMIGLLFFVVFFTVVVSWTLRPGAKKMYKEYGSIPLEESE